MNFFNIPAIENDEYIYSYVLRLANANGFDLKTFLQIVLNQIWGYNRKKAYDLDFNIVKISELIGLENTKNICYNSLKCLIKKYHAYHNDRRDIIILSSINTIGGF